MMDDRYDGWTGHRVVVVVMDECCDWPSSFFVRS